MDDDQFDKLIAAIITAGYMAGHNSIADNAGKYYLRIEKSLRGAGVISIQSGSPPTEDE